MFYFSNKFPSKSLFLSCLKTDQDHILRYHLVTSSPLLRFYAVQGLTFTHMSLALLSSSLHSIYCYISIFSFRFNFLLESNEIKVHYWKSSKNFMGRYTFWEHWLQQLRQAPEHVSPTLAQHRLLPGVIWFSVYAARWIRQPRGHGCPTETPAGHSPANVLGCTLTEPFVPALSQPNPCGT